jgi:hypothetical protein
MGKLPWTPWYFADWLRDPSLRSVSLSARGLWADMLAYMWESPERGVLPKLNELNLSKLVGSRKDLVTRLVRELEFAKVFSRRKKDKCIFSRRMVREELVREKARKRQQKHRANVTPPVTRSSQVEAEEEVSSESESYKHSQDAVVEEAVKANGNGHSASPSAALTRAFYALGHTPFGSRQFQNIWLEQYNQAGNDPNWTDIMEMTIQICQGSRPRVTVPGLFYKHKHEIENGEVKMRYKVTPL